MEMEHGVLWVIQHILAENADRFGIQIFLIVHVAKRVGDVGIVRGLLLSALRKSHSLIQILAAIGTKIGQIVQRQGVFRFNRENFVIGVVSLGLLAQRL